MIRKRFILPREGADSTKCTVCGKTVYVAEKIDMEMKGEKKLFHKLCFKCSVCGVILNLRNYDSLNGILYCKSHLPVAQQAKNAFFVSPLHVQTDEMMQKLSIDKAEGMEAPRTVADQVNRRMYIWDCTSNIRLK